MFQVGDVVYSAAGHDKDSFYVIVRMGQDGSCFIADGRRRKRADPKRKNQKHLRPTQMRVAMEGLDNDSALRKALAALFPPEAEQAKE